MSINEAWKDQPVLDVGNGQIGMAVDNGGMRTEVPDHAVFNHQQPVVQESCSVLLPPEMLPWIIHEVEEDAAKSRWWSCR